MLIRSLNIICYTNIFVSATSISQSVIQEDFWNSYWTSSRWVDAISVMTNWRKSFLELQRLIQNLQYLSFFPISLRNRFIEGKERWVRWKKEWSCIWQTSIICTVASVHILYIILPCLYWITILFNDCPYSFVIWKILLEFVSSNS